MNLLDLLEIQRDRLPRRTRQAAVYVENRWWEQGAPVEPKALAEFLDTALHQCENLLLFYPKVLLWRLKQLQRCEWAPSQGGGCERPQQTPGNRSEPSASEKRNNPDEDILEKIRLKEQKGEFDEDVKALLREKQRRALERRANQPPARAGEWNTVGQVLRAHEFAGTGDEGREVNRATGK
jgi:hypothetical protein